MPFLLLFLSIATLATVASQSKKPPRRGQTFTLDANLPPALRNQVLAALVTGTDPVTLDAFATAIQAQYPLSAGLLHQRAAALRAGMTSLAPQQPPPPQMGSPSGGPALDANLPPSLAAYVQLELQSDTDPNHLLVVANALQPLYPIAAGLLASKAAILNVQSPAPSVPAGGGPPAVGTPVSVVSANPPAPVLSIPGLDLGMPPDVAQAVMVALINETDPSKLQAMAAQLQGQYPLAASLLAMKAASLAPQAAPPAMPVVVSPPAVLAPSGGVGGASGLDANIPPDVAQTVLNELANEGDPVKLQALAAQLAPQYPIAAALLQARANVILVTRPPIQLVPTSGSPDGSGGTYVVQQDDFAWKIADKLTGHGARWPELVAANPQKPRAKDGNFATLLPGETLTLPGAWANAAPTAARMTRSPSPKPATTATPAAPSGLDPGIPANVAAAVRTALQTATDASQVRGFASAVQSQGFPVAAALLNAKANTLDAPQPPMESAALHAPSGGDGGGGKYTVKAGDSPSKIAAALVHDSKRWKELVAANPGKKRAANGNFASLQPGESLDLPPTWTVPTNGVSAGPMTLSHAPLGGA